MLQGPTAQRRGVAAAALLSASSALVWLTSDGRAAGSLSRLAATPVELVGGRDGRRHPIYRELMREMDRAAAGERRQKRLMKLGEDPSGHHYGTSASLDDSGNAQNAGHDWDPCDGHDLTKCEPGAPAGDAALIVPREHNVFDDWDEEFVDDDEGWQGRGDGRKGEERKERGSGAREGEGGRGAAA